MSVRTRWVIATGNLGKLGEIREILADAPVELESLENFDEIDFPEEGLDYVANAIAKARTAARSLGVIAVGDDSGIEVEALDWGPGPISARYGGPDLDDPGRVAKLLGALEGLSPERRRARFVCHAALATPQGDVVTASGECRGEILNAPRGENGFGYDPVFRPEGREESMAELPAKEKNRLSHRARAFRELWQRWAGEGGAA